MVAPRAFEVRGLREFRRELRAIDPKFPKELRLAHKAIADDVATKARSIASGSGGVQAKAAGAIKGYATQSNARVGIATGKSFPMANVAFWGAKKRTGWYGASKYAGSGGRQHPEWVGNTWDVGVAGQGPYAINDAIASMNSQILDEYADAIGRLMAKAFPD